MIKQCVVCGCDFKAPPSSKRVTCGAAECKHINASRKHKGISTAGRNFHHNPASDINLHQGASAAVQSPKGGRKETNHAAKVWTLIDPSGKEHTVRNLLHWARANYQLFGKPPGDRSATQISGGFRAICQTLSGYRFGGKRRPALSYFGWTLKNIPTTPADD